MKLITRDTDYAIRALCFMSQRQKKVISVAQLVDALNIPRPFLRKILQLLNKKSIVKSYRGKGGGFTLARPATKIFLVEIIEIFQGQVRLNECFFKRKICWNVRNCRLKKRVDGLERYVTKKLQAIDIRSLVD